MTETTTIRVDFISESAAFRNTFGWYNSTTGEGGILFAGVEAQGAHPTVVPGVSYAEFSVDTDDLNNIQFFLIANGDGISRNTDEELSGPIKVIQLANGTWAVATADEDGNVETDHFGRPNILIGEGANAFFTETSKNAGGVDYASSTVGPGQTAGTLAGDTADGLTGIIAWEDLAAKLRRNGTYTQPGDADYNDAVFQVSVSNQPPAAVADSNAGDPVIESGVGPDGAPFAGDSTATGNVLGNDSDADGDTLTVVGVAVGNVAGPVSGSVGATLTGTYGTLNLDATGLWTYALNNADGDTDALARDQAASDVFSYTISDGHGGTATATLAVNITGTNDAPVITGGATAGAVQEDGTLSATGTLAASDVDNGALLTWSVSGGVSVVPSAFHIGVDHLKVTKGGSVVFEDNFNDGVPPPSLSNDAGTPFAFSYGVGGTVVEVGGRAVLDYAASVPSDFFGSPDPGVFNGFNLLSNVNPADPVSGLKRATDFEVEARFDLSIPDDNREQYGIRLADRQIGGGGNPPDHVGDDGVDLIVRRDIAGNVLVTFRRIDFVTETVTNLHVIPLMPPPGADQIVLRLSHVANTQDVQGSFDYLSAGVVVGTDSFAGSVPIFTNEIWTRAQIVASAPEQATSVLDADYGTPTIDQFGNWTYTLANARTNVQALADGQTAIDTFTVQVTDEHGASASQTVNVTVAGSNDAPFIGSGSPAQPAQRFFAEIGDLAPGENATVHSATGLIAFLDRDLIDTHIATVTELGSGYRGVLTASVTTDSTDGHGGYVTWNFNVADSALDTLAQGQTLVQDYVIAVDDGHGGTDARTIRVNITGTNDAPVITSGPGSGTVTENALSAVSGLMTAFDPDDGAVLTWTVVGGSAPQPADYEFFADNFRITKNGGVIFEDPFSDASPPPNSPPFANGDAHTYGITGTFLETGGKLILDSDNAAPIVSVGTPDPFIGNFANVRSNIDPANLERGLKSDDDFTVEGLFDLIIPDSPREVYGIRLSDRLVGGSGTPPDQLGDDQLELVVRKAQDGVVRVQFREIDTVNDQVVNIGAATIAPPPGTDQILLRLTHSTTDVGALHASFDYLSGGVVIGSGSLPQIGRIFGTETPGFMGDDENWTRAQIFAYAPTLTDTTLAGTYGSLTVGQGGSWTYALANSQINVQNLAQGQTAIDTFTVEVMDEFGASDTETISITVIGSNDAPVIFTGPAFRTVAEDSSSPTLTETGLSFFSDLDLTDTHTVSPFFISATLSDGSSVPAGVLGAAFGALSATIIDLATGDSDGHYQWDFALDNSLVQFLAVGQTLTLAYNVTAFDNHGAAATQTVTIDITGTNDAPVITSGPGSGTVTENATSAVSGLMTAFDPDDGAQQFWTVVGGSAPQAADYTFAADNFRVTKNGGGFLNDPFSDGSPPPSSPPFANGDTHTYGVTGTFLEAGGRLILDSDNAAPIVSVGTPDPFIGNFAGIRSNIDPENLVRGLKSDDDFVVEGLFDLIIPDSPREVYGIRLSDRLVGGSGTPPDQLGDDMIELVVRKAQDGIVRVQLREIDAVNDQVVNIGAVPIVPPPGTDQILLRLTHSTTNVGALLASFDYLSGGVVIGSVSLAPVGRIFGTETPGFTGDDENWTMAQMFAYAPAITDTTLAGTYGSLTVGQGGSWTYALANSQVNVQNLAQGQTAIDTFTVEVADEFGASDTETISITVVGSNDAPVIVTGPAFRAVAEDSSSPTLTETGLSFFFDIDLADTHTISPFFVSATLSDGTSVPPAVFAAAVSALSTTLLDPATGDSDGHYRWDFALDNGLVQFLAEGQTLTLAYNVTAFDNHGAAATQTVTINVTGTNDAPQITGGPVSASVTENVSPTAIGSIDAFDPDTGAQEFWTVVGGTGAAAAAYTFVMDDLRIIKNGNTIFQDPFSDGLAPPSSPNFANGTSHTYAISGGFQEAGDKLIIDAAAASAAVSVGTPDPFIGNFATVRTNIDPADLVAGLKNDDDFTVEGLFDLIIPDSPREVYGIRLHDRLIGGPGTPPDQLGDDGIELVVRQGVDGILRVQLREIDFVNDQVVNIGGVVLSPPPGADQILLRLTHSTADIGALQASFDYLAGGVVVGSETLAQVGRIFGTETPGFTGDDENWTRAQVIAYAPAVTDSTLAGTYGTLTIDQAGVWTYNLANNQIGVQNLAEGETAVDTFAVQVTDEHGASDTETVSVTVVGTNDPPAILTGPVSRNLQEDGAPTLTATGDAFFFDVDLIDTHTFTPSLTSATLSNGVSVSAGVLAAAGSALSATLLDPATGDSDGHYRWDFALDNSVVDFLTLGETLTLTYDVAATDNHGGADTQVVTIHIEGTDDWLLVA